MVSDMSAKTFTVEPERVEKTATMFLVAFDLGDAASAVERVAAGKAPA